MVLVCPYQATEGGGLPLAMQVREVGGPARRVRSPNWAWSTGGTSAQGVSKEDLRLNCNFEKSPPYTN